jgi:Bacterial Ig-like domain
VTRQPTTWGAGAASPARKRLLALALALALALTGGCAAQWLLAATADAGSYPVYACGAGGVADNRSWTSDFNHGGMTVYDACPAINGADGLATRHVVSPNPGWTDPFGAYARWTFTAPPGAAVAAVSADANVRSGRDGWAAGLVNGGGAWIWCGGPCIASWLSIQVPTGAEGQVSAQTMCLSWPACSIDGGLRGYLYLRNVTVTVADSTPPALGQLGGSAWTDAWQRGRGSVAFDASDNVGVQRTALYLDGQRQDEQAWSCDYSRPAPCAGGNIRWTLSSNVAALLDGDHTLTVEATDTAGNSQQAARTIHVDNTPPGPVGDLALTGGGEWRHTNDFAVSFTVPARRANQAPIVAARYQLCAARTQACQPERRVPGTALTALTAIKLPAPGEYALRVWLEDTAGNASSETAPRALLLGYDPEAPASAAFEPQDPSDPRRVSVLVKDDISGLGSGQIEVSRAGSGEWREIPAGVHGDRLVGQIDDTALPRGRYELRARVADKAGNTITTATRQDGGQATVTVPLRVRILMAAGARTRRHRARLARTIRVPYNRLVAVHGRLTTVDHQPMRNAIVRVLSRLDQRGATPRALRSITTSRTGRFVYRTRARASRQITLHYPGTDVLAEARRTVTLRVPARSTLHVSRHFVLNGESVRFSGRLRGGHFPAGGRLIELQARYRDAWHTFATAQTTPRGRWRYTYRFEGTHGRQTYAFRVRIPRQADYPFAAGHSRPRRVTVRGL